MSLSVQSVGEKSKNWGKVFFSVWIATGKQDSILLKNLTIKWVLL